jgi:hypothetical protein
MLLVITTCLDEAVVEGHADEAGANAGVLADGPADDGADDELRLGAAAAVVTEPEPLARGSEEQHAREPDRSPSSSHLCSLSLQLLTLGRETEFVVDDY